jgi:EAL domain-containing protein (putative c-di-GMP-specific phosphodiesterase class I)
VELSGAAGVELLSAIRSRGLAVPVVLVTGCPSIETAVSAIELGAVSYLTRPVAAAELVRSVERAVGLNRRAHSTSRGLLRRRRGIPNAERASVESQFGRGLASLYMAYQPIVRARDGSVFGWEALLRTREPGIAGPLAFIEMAERLDRVRELGRTIRESVATTAGHTRGVMFFVNLHAEDLEDDRLYDARSPLSAIAPEIVLEITERDPLDAVPDVRDRVKRLRALGYRLAVDDLGSGYSGLASFASLEPDFVKLDRELVRGIDRHPVKRKVVSSIVGVSRDLGTSVVAEGIETAGERDAATEAGCNLMQGFFFRRPEELRAASAFAVGSRASD